MVARFSRFYRKISIGFCLLTLEKAFCYNFHLKANRKSIASSKKQYQDFQNSPPFERSACSYVTISENLKRFQQLNFETDFLKNEKFFQKLEYRFLVESTRIENASFPYKTATSEVNGKTNYMVTTNGPITKNGVLPVTTLFLSKYCFSLRTFYKELI